MTQPPVLNYARPTATHPLLPGRYCFLAISILGMLSVFVPINSYGFTISRSLWETCADLQYGFSPRKFCIFPLAAFFLPWPLTFIKLRLLFPRPWGKLPLALAATVAAVSWLPAPSFICYMFLFLRVSYRIDPVEILFVPILFGTAAVGFVFAWAIGRRHSLPAALHVLILACYISLPIFITLQGIAEPLRSGPIDRLRHIGYYVFVFLALGGIVELLAWLRLLRQRPHP